MTHRTPTPAGSRGRVARADMPTNTDLTAADRCDRCCAQAQHRVELVAGELLFCGHHYDEHKDRLPQSPAAAASGHAGE